MIAIELDRSPAAYSSGEALVFTVGIERSTIDQVERAEASVLWYTEGKGDEDLAVHEFWEVTQEQMVSFFGDKPHPFRSLLPSSPLSYEGRLIKIRWCVRLRVFMASGEEIVTQQAFYLGPLTNEV